MTTSTKRDWVRMIGITGTTLIVAGAVTMGGLWTATATGLIDVPTRIGNMGGRGGMMGEYGGNMGGRGGMMGEYGGNMGGRGGMMGEYGGNMGGRGGMMGEHGGNMGGRGGMFARMMGDQSYLTHLLVALQNEQAIANLLADSNTAAKVIAESRAKDIAALTELQKTWYPDSAIPSTTVSTATIDDLKVVLLQNTVMIERISDATFEHPELATWLNQHMIQRANEIANLYGQQS
jgi:hypothetical protein